MSEMSKIARLGKIQLKRLREDVCLGSLFIRDYENRYGIDAHTVWAFFDGFEEYIEELMAEKGDKRNFYIARQDYDTLENLRNWQDALIASLN